MTSSKPSNSRKDAGPLGPFLAHPKKRDTRWFLWIFFEGRKCVGVFQKIMITLDLFLGVPTTMALNWFWIFFQFWLVKCCIKGLSTAKGSVLFFVWFLTSLSILTAQNYFAISRTQTLQVQTLPLHGPVILRVLILCCFWAEFQPFHRCKGFIDSQHASKTRKFPTKQGRRVIFYWTLFRAGGLDKSRRYVEGVSF